MPWWRRQARERDLERELRSHLELESESGQELGLSSRDAADAAHRALGNVALIQELTREMWGWTSVERLVQDGRYALRMLRKSPGFTAVVVLTLALGIGANTAIFSLIDAVLFYQAPYPDAARLVNLRQSLPALGEARMGASPSEYLDYRNDNRAFLSIAGYEAVDFDLTGAGEPDHVPAARVTSNLFPTLGVSAQLGRTFSDSEDRFGAGHVALISDSYWRRRYGGKPDVLNQTIRLNEQSYAIIGVMPPGFEFPASQANLAEPPALWVPMAFTNKEVSDRAASFQTSVVARLKPGVSLSQARDDVSRVASAFELRHPDIYSGNIRLQTTVEPLEAEVSARARPVLLTLAGAVCCVLLIACANVANLLLARAAVRRREMAVRSALGAGVARLMRQLFTESIMLTFLGGALGTALAAFLLTAASRLWQGQVIGLRGAHIDARALGFTLILSAVTGLVCGLAPALGWTRPDLSEALKQAGRQIGASRARASFRGTLVVLEASAAVLLLVGAGLLIHSFVRVLQVSPGFDPDGVLVVRTSFNRDRYPDANQRRQTEKTIGERLASIPGVAAVGLTTHLPLADDRAIGFALEDQDQHDTHWAANALVSGEYFAAMGIALRQGRTFDSRDTPQAPLAAIVNQAFVTRYWPAGDALGRRVVWGGRRLTIVGIVADVHLKALDIAGEPTIYVPVYQVESGATTSAVYILRTKPGSGENLGAAIRSAVWPVDRGLPLFALGNMRQIVARSLTQRWFAMTLLAGFSGLALALAVIGLYGVLSYAVAQRTQELGVRLALGAAPVELVRLVIREGFQLVVLGVAVGIAAAVAAARGMSAMLFGIPALDPATFISAATVLLAVGLLACSVPAYRASRIDPILALRNE